MVSSLTLIALALLGVGGAQDPAPAADVDPARILGKELYDRACARCHGADGKGDRPDIQLNAPMPNFARCAESAEEPDDQWRLTIEKGGVVYGLSSQMPAYGDVLTAEQIDSLLTYLRAFCSDRRWVRGELNFERPLFTEKAYPENELVIAPRMERRAGAGPDVSVEVVLERRIGPTTQLEFKLPVSSLAPDGGIGRRQSGIGDLELGVKQVLYANLDRGYILAAGADVVLPTGRRAAGLGAGTTRFEPFLSAGKALGRWVVQGEVKLELPAKAARAPREIGYSAAVGYPVRTLGAVRALFAALEIVGARELVRNAPHELLLSPQLRLPVDRLGRWAVAVGPTLPVTQRGSARAGFAAYLLFEYLGR